MWSDRGEEFYNTAFLDFLKQNEIQIYPINSDLKAVFVERFNEALLDLIKEPMYIEGKGNWLNHLDVALQKYNNCVHGTTKMTPFEMSFKTATRETSHTAIPNPILNDKIKLPKFPKFPKFQTGDFVKIPDKRNIYSKGYTTNWSRELLKIHKLNEPSNIHFGR